MATYARGGSTRDSETTRIPAARRKMQEAQFFFSRLGRKPPEDTLFSDEEVYRFNLSAFLSAAKSLFTVATKELQNGKHVTTWKETLVPEDREFLSAVLEQRNIETHGRGIKVEEQEFHFEPIPGRGWLSNLVPERFFVIGERRYGGYFAASRILGLMADFLAYVEKRG